MGMISDNHYNPVPLTDLKVGDYVAFVDAMGNLNGGTIIAIGLKTATIETERENPIVGGKLQATAPYDLMYRLPTREELESA